jgi:phenylpropionate dioxygenase-like ring-hydroxylating dioxygenase large terminal subunit
MNRGTSGPNERDTQGRRLSDGTLIRDLFDHEKREVSLRVHHDREIFDLEMERIFAHSWIPVAHESEIPKTGDYVRRFAGQDSCLIVRNEDGSISALLNACAHRGMALCRDEKGTAQTFKCPYHGWAYNKRGKFIGAPFEVPMYGNTLRDSIDDLALRTAKTAMLGGMIFVNWDHAAEPFDTYLGEFGWYLRAALERTNQGLEVIGPPQRNIMRANWKLLAEQLADGYHARALHQSASDMGTLGHVPHDPASWGMIGVNVATAGGHTLRCIDAKSTYSFAGIDPNASAAAKLATIPPPGTNAALTKEFPNNLSEGQIRMLADTPPMIMGLFPGADFFTFMSVGGTDDGKHGPVMVARAWIPREPDLFEMLSWIMVEKGASAQLREQTRLTSIRNFGISGAIEQDDAEAWQGIQRTVKGPVARQQTAKYSARLEPTRPEGFEGGGEVYAGFSRDDAQWAWWRRYAEVIGS